MRFFPRTARPRLVAASAACTLAIGAVAVPLAHAEDLKHRQHHVQGQIKSANHDLDESSARLRRATGALDAALAELSRAKAQLVVVRTKLVAAHLRDREMQAKLEAAEQRLAAAQADLVAGRSALDDQHTAVTNVITSIYEEGDPELLAFSALLNAETPADLTRQSEARSAIVGRQTRAYDDLHAAEVLLKVREHQVELARDDVAVQRRAAADHLVEMRALGVQTRQARAHVHDMVVSRRSAHRAAASARRHDRAVLARLHAQENRIRERILAAARRAAARHPHAGFHGRTGGYLNRPVNGPITSPFGYREHPIYHYWGLHDGDDFGAGCGQPLDRRRRRHRDVGVLLLGVGQPPLPQPRPGQRQEPHRDLQPPVGVPGAQRPARGARPGRRQRRHHRLVHRLPPPLHRDGQRLPGGPHQLVLSQAEEQPAPPRQVHDGDVRRLGGKSVAGG